MVLCDENLWCIPPHTPYLRWRIIATCEKKKKKSYVGLIKSYVGDNISYVGLISSYVGF